MIHPGKSIDSIELVCMTSIPTPALDGGAGGIVLDFPGTTAIRGTASATLRNSAGGGQGVAGSGITGNAPISIPGPEEADEQQQEAALDAAVGSAGEDEVMAEDESGPEDDREEDEEEEEEREDPNGRSKTTDASAVDAGPSTSKNAAARVLKTTGAAATFKKAAGQSGISQLPTARVKKIILSDPDVDSCGKEATFAIGKACEIYIHHLVESAYTQARLDKRRAVVYKDVSRAIKNTPYLEFLMDVVPAAMPLSLALTERQRHLDFEGAEAADAAIGPEEEQTMEEEATADDFMAEAGVLAAPFAAYADDHSQVPLANGHASRTLSNGHSKAEMDLDATSVDQVPTHHRRSSTIFTAPSALQVTQAEPGEIGMLN